VSGVRDGRRRSARQRPPGAHTASAKPAAAIPAPGGARLGLGLRPLNAEEHGASGIRGGLLVEGASGAAARAGIRPGDVVLSVNGTPAATVDQRRAPLERVGPHVALLIQREDARIFVPVPLG
jgi:serine protease Do